MIVGRELLTFLNIVIRYTQVTVGLIDDCEWVHRLTSIFHS